MTRLGLALILSTLATSASAIDFTQPVLDLDGNPICMTEKKPDDPCPSGKIATLSILIRNALDARFPNDPPESGDVKQTRYEIAVKIKNAVDPVLTPEEIAEMKRMVGKAFPMSIVGPIWKTLNSAVK